MPQPPPPRGGGCAIVEVMDETGVETMMLRGLVRGRTGRATTGILARKEVVVVVPYVDERREKKMGKKRKDMETVYYCGGDDGGGRIRCRGEREVRKRGRWEDRRAVRIVARLLRRCRSVAAARQCIGGGGNEIRFGVSQVAGVCVMSAVPK